MFPPCGSDSPFAVVCCLVTEAGYKSDWAGVPQRERDATESLVQKFLSKFSEAIGTYLPFHRIIHDRDLLGPIIVQFGNGTI